MKNHTQLIMVKLSSISLILLVLLTACSGGNAAQPQAASQLAGAASLQTSPRSEKEVAKLAPPLQVDIDDQTDDLGLAQPGPEAGQSPVEPGLGGGDGNPSPQGSPVEPPPLVEPVGPAPTQAEPAVQATVDPSLPVGPQVGLRAPDFSLQTLDGQTVQLADLAGRPVVINYWATWCIPCKAELPILERIYREYHQQGLVIISVNATDQDTVEDVQSLVAELGMTFPVLLDPGKQFSSTYQAMFFPTTVFIDASGVIRHIQLGDSTEEKLRANILSILAGGL